MSSNNSGEVKRMELELTSDETSTLAGILVVWKTRVKHGNYEDLLISSVLNKIFEEDKRAVEKVLS